MKKFFPILLISFTLISLASFATHSLYSMSPDEKQILPKASHNTQLGEFQSTSTMLDIPTLQWIRENGYPVNGRGESYGPDVKENLGVGPDLILATNEDGIQGYLRASDLDIDPQTTEEALSFNRRSYVIPLYLHDGITCIGAYTIGN